jgi:hypothetical protein
VTSGVLIGRDVKKGNENEGKWNRGGQMPLYMHAALQIEDNDTKNNANNALNQMQLLLNAGERKDTRAHKEREHCLETEFIPEMPCSWWQSALAIFLILRPVTQSNLVQR